MKRWLSAALILWLVSSVAAQTATPTPTNTPTPTVTVAPLYEGMYEFESLSAPYIQLSSGWSVLTETTGRVYLRTTTANAKARFYVNGAWIYLNYRKTNANGVSDGFTICWGAACGNSLFISTYATNISEHEIAIPIEEETQLIITNSSGALNLNYFQALQGSILSPTPSPTYTPSPTPTPTDSPYIYATAAANGQLTRFDYTASAGDVLHGILLLFLLFSIWGMAIYKILNSKEKS